MTKYALSRSTIAMRPQGAKPLQFALSAEDTGLAYGLFGSFPYAAVAFWVSSFSTYVFVSVDDWLYVSPNAQVMYDWCAFNDKPPYTYAVVAFWSRRWFNPVLVELLRAVISYVDAMVPCVVTFSILSYTCCLCKGPWLEKLYIPTVKPFITWSPSAVKSGVRTWPPLR